MCVEVPVVHVFPHIHQEQFDLFSSPLQRPRKEHDTQGIDTLRHVDLLEETDLLQARVFGPRADGDLQNVLLHVDKPCIFHPPFQMPWSSR